MDNIEELSKPVAEVNSKYGDPEAAAQDDADWHKLVDSKNDVISHLASGIINLKAAQKENANDNKLKYISRLEAEKQTEANTINLQRRMNLELMTENAGLKKRAKKAEAELSAAQKEVGAAAYRIHELESQWENRAPTSFAYDAACSALHIYQERAEKAEAALSAANEKLLVPAGYCIMPESLTAENGAKGALSGEFFTETDITCEECGGDCDEDDPCEHCNGLGFQTVRTAIGWSIIKDIYKMAVGATAIRQAGFTVEGE
ncbi:hypothetical protein BA192_07950 [Yersinia pseudotuberculosis]|uniref:hypothetical protein n=1 Tax=Yersinia pseudotuberculosis TaxID=633 RepID=UPI000D0ADFBC|nr:hypothetical protein [Yersinia pseudotuberculosis]PSH38364.1 hypothetical protein BA192_07950 [Yersinia pseudotuberculosis]